jgi:hypothetical protein
LRGVVRAEGRLGAAQHVVLYQVGSQLIQNITVKRFLSTATNGDGPIVPSTLWGFHLVEGNDPRPHPPTEVHTMPETTVKQTGREAMIAGITSFTICADTPSGAARAARLQPGKRLPHLL